MSLLDAVQSARGETNQPALSAGNSAGSTPPVTSTPSLLNAVQIVRKEVAPTPVTPVATVQPKKNIAQGAFKVAKRAGAGLGVAVANIASDLIDFSADFLASSFERTLKQPLVGIGVPGVKNIAPKKITEGNEKLAEKWRNFYDQKVGVHTDNINKFTEDLWKAEIFTPSKKWQEATVLEKATKYLPESILQIGPSVISSWGTFAINPYLGYATSVTTTANDVTAYAVQAGIPKQKAELIGLTTGLMVGWLDKLVPDEVFSPGQKAKFTTGLVKRIFKTGLKEMGTEMAQEGLQMAVEATLREDLKLDEAGERIALAGLGGFLGGVGARGVVDLANGVRGGDIGNVSPEEVTKPEEKVVKKVSPLEVEGLDEVTNKKIQDLNVADASNPVEEGKVRVYQATGKGMSTDWYFDSPEALAKFKNNTTTETDEFKYADVDKSQLKPVDGKPGVFRVSEVAVVPVEQKEVVSKSKEIGEERILEKITGVKQPLSDYADYLMTDESSVKQVIKDFTDYGRINTLTDKEINNLTERFIALGDDSLGAYKDSIKEYAGLTDAGSLGTVKQMNNVVKSFSSVLDELNKAKTRLDKVLAIDKLIKSEHSRGGRVLTYGYGIGDVDRGDNFLGKTMDWLRNQKEFTPEQLSQISQAGEEKVSQPKEKVISKPPTKEVKKVAVKKEVSKPKPKVEAPPVDEFQSRVYERLSAEHPEILTEEALYNRQTFDKQYNRATDLLSKDKNKLYRIATGVDTDPDLSPTTANIVMAEKALEEGNNSLYASLVKHRSFDLTRKGQDIVFEKGSVTDNSTSRYVKELISQKLNDVGRKYTSVLDKIKKKSPQKKALEVIDAKVEEANKKINNKRMDIREAQNFIDSLICK